MKNQVNIDTIVIHHSASPLNTTVNNIERWHRARGFSDIGYHFLIDSAGIIHKGRPVNQVGAHCKGHNINSIGICGIGNNTILGQHWTSEQVVCIQEFVSWLCDIFEIYTIEGHRDMPGASTECPGVGIEWSVRQGTGKVLCEIIR